MRMNLINGYKEFIQYSVKEGESKNNLKKKSSKTKGKNKKEYTFFCLFSCFSTIYGE